MSDRPYATASYDWLVEHEQVFRGILKAASAHKVDLDRLLAVSSQSPMNLLDFVELDNKDIATAMKVCDKLAEGLSPTANAMRTEIEQRQQQMGSPKLPVL